MSEQEPLLNRPRPPARGLQRGYTEELARLVDQEDRTVFGGLVGAAPSEPAEPAAGSAHASARERNREQTGRNFADLRRLQTRETFVALLLVFGVIMCVVTMASFVYYWYGWLVYFWYRDAPCDQPLQKWLLSFLTIDVVKGLLEVRGTAQGCCAKFLKVCFLLMTPLWLAYGVHLHRNVEQCSAEVDSFIFYFLLVQISAWLIKSVLFVAVFVVAMWFIDLNLVRSQRAAGKQLAEQLPQVPFSPGVFSDAEDAKAPPECSICQEDFCAGLDPAQRICVTPCGHYFHTACLGEWFERDRVCPLCRHDIAASKGAGEP